jgi:hypothetical protein
MVPLEIPYLSFNLPHVRRDSYRIQDRQRSKIARLEPTGTSSPSHGVVMARRLRQGAIYPQSRFRRDTAARRVKNVATEVHESTKMSPSLEQVARDRPPSLQRKTASSSSPTLNLPSGCSSLNDLLMVVMMW